MARWPDLTILARSGHSGHSGPDGRLGPPESVKSREKPEKHGKGHFWPFLRVPRASGQGCPEASIGARRHLHYAGLGGLLEPSQRSRCLDGSSVVRAFPGPSPGP